MKWRGISPGYLTIRGIDTCAATGLCADRCPVGINTGSAIKKLRSESTSASLPIARWSADHFAGVTLHGPWGPRPQSHCREGAGRQGAGRIGERGSPSAASAPRLVAHTCRGRAATGGRKGRGAMADPAGHWRGSRRGLSAVCASRVFGQQEEAPSLPDVVQSLLNKAGCRVMCRKGIEGLCCGMPRDSRGMVEVAAAKRSELAEALWQASEQEPAGPCCSIPAPACSDCSRGRSAGPSGV